jgi:hypothetical protein
LPNVQLRNGSGWLTHTVSLESDASPPKTQGDEPAHRPPRSDSNLPGPIPRTHNRDPAHPNTIIQLAPRATLGTMFGERNELVPPPLIAQNQVGLLLGLVNRPLERRQLITVLLP